MAWGCPTLELILIQLEAVLTDQSCTLWQEQHLKAEIFSGDFKSGGFAWAKSFFYFKDDKKEWK